MDTTGKQKLQSNRAGYGLPLILMAMFSAPLAAQTPPTVLADSYGVNVNGFLSASAASGLLANDTGFNASTHRLESYDTVSQYGAVVLVAADGSFSYDPPPGFKGVDSFAYSVRNAFGANRAVVSIDVSGETVWFVDDSVAAGGDGTFNAPFNNLASLNGSSGAGDADAAGDTIFVYAGTYSVEFDVEAGQTLMGHSEGLDLVGTGNDISASTAPILNNSGTFPIVELFGAGATVRGFVINNSNSYAIQGASVSNFTLANIDINAGATATGGILLNGVSGINAVNDVDISGAIPASNSALLLLSNSGTINFVGSSVSSFTGGYVLNVNGNSGSILLDSTSDLTSTNTRGLTIQTQTATGVVTLAGVDLDGGMASEPLIRLLNNDVNSTVNFEEGVLADATAVNAQALNANGGKLKIAGTNSVLTSADGAVIELQGAELTQNATFASLSSTSSNVHGISIASPIGNNDLIVTGTTTIITPTTEAIRVTSPGASGFMLQMARLTSTGGTVGIQVSNARVDVTDSASTLTTSAGPAVLCTTGTTNLALATLTAAGGANGVSFDACSGTVTATGGTLNSTAGVGNAIVNIVNSSGTNAVNISYGGNLNKTTSGAAVNIVGLSGAGAATFNGTVTGTNASGGVFITNTSRPVTFTTLSLGTGVARFATTPATLAGNTGAVDLGVLSSYTNNVGALNINYLNASPGLVTTDPGSILDATGAVAALTVSHSIQQPLNLSFASIASTGAGTHAVNIIRSTGSITVSGLTNIGAKTTAGIQITNTNNLNASFQEVDISGAADGVRLSNNTGSFTILGDGDFLNVGTNGAGGTFTNLTDNAFDLNGVANFRATDLTINGTGGHGVTGTGVNGMTIFSNVDMTNIGNANDEHVYNFQQGAVSGAQVTGTLNINNSLITNFTETGLYLENFAGALILRFTDNVLTNNITTTACSGGNCDGHGILLRADGTSTITALIENNNFNQIDGIGITANPEGNTNARMDLTINQNTFAANTYAGPSNTNNGEIGISLRNQQGDSDLYFIVNNNSFIDYSGEFAQGIVEVEGGDFTTTHGTIVNNTFFHAYFGSPIGLNADGAFTGGGATPTNFDFVVAVTNNNVPSSVSMSGSALFVLGRGGITGSDANAQITVTGNTFGASPTALFTRTLMTDFGGFNRGCFNVAGNTIAAGVGGSRGVDMFYDGSATMRLQGMSGTGDANAITRVGSTNTVTGGVFVGSNNTITAATCTTPTAPNPVP